MTPQELKELKRKVNANRPTFVVVLRGEPNFLVIPKHRLRALLKVALRSFGFRCIDMWEE